MALHDRRHRTFVILLETGEDGRVATLTLNRPDRLNAFTTRMQRELVDALDRVDALWMTGVGCIFGLAAACGVAWAA